MAVRERCGFAVPSGILEQPTGHRCPSDLIQVR
jgi:hypothetical protein